MRRKNKMAQPKAEVFSKNPTIGSENSSERKAETIWVFDVVYLTLTFRGMTITGDYWLRQKKQITTNYIVTNVIYYFSYIIQLFFVDNLRLLLENVSMNICLTGCTIQFFVILKLRPSIIEINKRPNRLNSRPMTDMQKDKLERVLNFCRLITLSTKVIFEGGSLAYALAAALSHGTELPFECCLPCDWRKNAFHYWGSPLMQTVFQLQLGLEQVLYLCIQIIIEQFANIHYDPRKTEDKSFQDFMQCLKDHRIVIEIFEIIQNAISLSIFLHFITSFLVFSTWGLIYLRFSPSFSETAAVFLFMVGVIREIYPLCYYSDTFMAKTDQMVFMLYSSNWTDLSPKLRKHLIVFMQMKQKEEITLVGKRIPITLITFMSVMKTMYNILMLLNPSE